VEELGIVSGGSVLGREGNNNNSKTKTKPKQSKSHFSFLLVGQVSVPWPKWDLVNEAERSCLGSGNSNTWHWLIDPCRCGIRQKQEEGESF